MSYPHVTRLVYRLKTDGTRSFKDPRKVERQTDTGYLRLKDDVLYVSMREHHETVENARERVEKYLRSWEINAALQYGGQPEVWFEFDKAEVLDLTKYPLPPPGTPQVEEISAHIIGTSALSATAHATSQEYPAPPDAFTASEDVEVMWTLYSRYKQGQDRLLPMAYTCLTRIRYSAGNQGNAASQYRVSKRVLHKLSELTSTLGQGVEARKFDSQGTRRAPTPQEVNWIEEALKVLIKRAGEYAANPHEALPKITMSDLPPL